MLLVYTHKVTPRLNYIFKHFFLRILQIPISFTTKVEEFVMHNGPKISYTKVALGSEFFIKSHELLFESASMRTLMQQVQLVAPTDATVLLIGESGTGKEVIAQQIHHHSACHLH